MFLHTPQTAYVHALDFRLDNTGFSPTAEADLERIRKSLNRPSGKELDLNYVPNAHLVEKRRQTN